MILSHMLVFFKFVARWASGFMPWYSLCLIAGNIHVCRVSKSSNSQGSAPVRNAVRLTAINYVVWTFLPFVMLNLPTIGDMHWSHRSPCVRPWIFLLNQNVRIEADYFKLVVKTPCYEQDAWCTSITFNVSNIPSTESVFNAFVSLDRFTESKRLLNVASECIVCLYPPSQCVFFP